MKIYLVVFKDYDNTSIEKAFSTSELAHEFCDKLNAKLSLVTDRTDFCKYEVLKMPLYNKSLDIPKAKYVCVEVSKNKVNEAFDINFPEDLDDFCFDKYSDYDSKVISDVYVTLGCFGKTGSNQLEFTMRIPVDDGDNRNTIYKKAKRVSKEILNNIYEELSKDEVWYSDPEKIHKNHKDWNFAPRHNEWFNFIDKWYPNPLFEKKYGDK